MKELQGGFQVDYEKYRRSFIMLAPQGGDGAAEGSQAEGCLKVETGNNKGALRCVVKNLNYGQEDAYDYQLLFLGKKKEKIIHALFGQIKINGKGNGEAYYRFDPLNMDGKGNAYHDFTVAIVAASSRTDPREPLHPVLRGTAPGEGQGREALCGDEEQKGEGPGAEAG
ncbi:MAG: hypothetical protein Q4C22_07560, partial [Bacillota bacterium]|nr:hypothetical protein [Bacillota bacterium]